MPAISQSHRWIIFALILFALMFWVQVKRSYWTRREALAASHQQAIAERQKDWARERVEREMKTLDATRARQRRHDQELEAALGGPAAAGAKNPDLAIAQSIQQVAKACAPKGAGVLVQINRFTEFTVLIELPTEADEAALAELGRCILTQSSPYLNLIQFSLRGRLLAEIGRREIESVADWTALSQSQMRQLLAASSGLLLETPSQPAAPAEEDQNSTQEMRAQKQAEDAYRFALESAQKTLRAALESEQAALDFTGVTRLADLTQRTSLLQKAQTLATQARAVLADPAAEYGRILKAARISEAYIRGAVRTEATRQQSIQPATIQMLDKHAERLRSAQEMLDAFALHFGDWTYNPLNHTYQFTAPGAHRAIKAAMDQYERATQNFEAAITQQADAIKASQSSTIDGSARIRPLQSAP